MTTEQGPGVRSLVLLLLALFLIASPFTGGWLAARPPWWTVYCVWGGLIVLIALLARQARRHEL